MLQYNRDVSSPQSKDLFILLGSVFLGREINFKLNTMKTVYVCTYLLVIVCVLHFFDSI